MGRFQTGRRGRFQGRRRGGANRKDKNSGKEKKKKTLSDYTFYLGSARQASDFEVTVEYIINYVRKTYDYGQDIATALEDLQEQDLAVHKPELEMSIETDPATRAHEEKQNELEFKHNYDKYRRRVRNYENNRTKAYGLLWDRCATGMQNKIQGRTNYDSEIKNNPIKLLQAIKEHALNYQENRYEMSIILDAMRTMMYTKQRENESLTDYTKLFKTARDVFVSHLGGPLILTKSVKNLEDYDEDDSDKQEELVNQAFAKLMAYLYLENADQDKYGSILLGLNTQKTLKNDQYPKSLTDANNVLSCHKFDQAYNKKTRARKENNTKKSKKDDNEDDKSDSTPALSFAQLEGLCYCCGEAGHKSPECDKRDSIAKKNWYIHKLKRNEQAHAQVNETKTNNSGTATTKDNSTISTKKPQDNSDNGIPRGWGFAHVALQFFNEETLRNCILLDNESTTSIFCNAKYVTNIRDADTLMDLKTNGGVLQSSKQCDFPTMPELQECWYNKAAITNILSYHNVASKYRITYDNMKVDEFVVHIGDRKLVFTPMKNGLYVWKPPANQFENSVLQDDAKLNFVELQAENKQFYTDAQITRAKRAREYFHAMGTPSVPDLLAMIRMNLVKNCPVTSNDVKLAEKIFGPDIGSIKGKTIRPTPAPVVNDKIDIPAELIQAQRNVTIDMDGISVNGVKFLTTISRRLYYRTAHYITNWTADSYEVAVTSLIGVYNHGGFILDEIHCDNEFRPLMTPLGQQYGIRMNFANPQEHVPRGERNNRFVKERVRSTYHRLPYKRIPRLMVQYLVTDSMKKANFYPARHSISQYYSPRMILTHQGLDYDKHCRYSFGQYVLGHDEPTITNTQHARALDCIYLAYNSNQQGGHILLHLPTGKEVIRRNVTSVPITPAIIQQVNAMATAQGMPAGLNVENKYGEVLYDSTWIAGVDFEEDSDSDDSDDDDEDYSDHSEDDDDDDDNDHSEDDDDNDNDQYDEVDPNEAADVLNEVPQGAPNPYESDESSIEDNENADDDAPKLDDNENDDDESIEQEGDETDLEPDEEKSANPSTDQTAKKTRSGRVSRAPERLNMFHEEADPDNQDNCDQQVYGVQGARVIAYVMNHIAEMAERQYAFVQTYGLKAGIKKFGERGKAAAHKEMKQLHDRAVFEPINIDELTGNERKKATESLIFLVEKRDRSIKARTCANGSVQRDYIDREEAASPTAINEAILITAIIDATQRRDVMIADVPNAFVQTPIPVEEDGDKIIMKIRGILVDMLVAMNPVLYEDHVIHQKSGKLLYVRMLKALYGMMIASLLYFKKFSADIKTIGFEQNPYDPCVANQIVNGKQHTITWHVDDIKSSHVDPKVNDEFKKWLEMKYGEDGIGKVKVTRGLKHDYLAMVLDFSDTGKLRLDMTDYVKGMITDFPESVGEVSCPWTDKLFKVDKMAKTLDVEKRKTFHTFVMKGMFVCKRRRQDIQPAIAFLCTRTKEPTESDWRKLVRVMGFLNKTKNDVLTLMAAPDQIIRWHVDASFAVHDDFKSHTGATLSLGAGVVTSFSTKQKVNARSSTEAELIGLDDVVTKILWTALFIEAQGFKARTVIARDNTSSMKLETNGKASCGKRTRHFHIKYFYITNLLERKIVEIMYCSIDNMLADYMTKPLVGSKFRIFRMGVMNLPSSSLSTSRSVLADRRINLPNLSGKISGEKSQIMNKISGQTVKIGRRKINPVTEIQRRSYLTVASANMIKMTG